MTKNTTRSLPDTVEGVPTARRALNVLNQVLALVLMVLGLPLFVAIAILILVVDGRPVLFRGLRLGAGMRPFTMYKFRSLKRGASAVIGAQLHSFRHRLTIPCGKFLRDTRLDEIPQLFNILKGDMNFFGPRPVRPEVFENHYRPLGNHGQRFSGKPGLVGISQLFTPHGAPKRLRLFADRRITLRDHSSIRETLYIVYALLAMTRTSIDRLVRYFWNGLLKCRVLRFHRDRREFRRVRPAHARVQIEVGRSRTVEATIIDMNEAALLVQLPEMLPDGGGTLPLSIEARFRRNLRPSSSRTRIARCTGRVIQSQRAPGGFRHVIAYDTQGELSRYVVDQYLLRESLASPFWSLGMGNGHAPSDFMDHGGGGLDGEPGSSTARFPRERETAVQKNSSHS